ncbi:hypothetical protein EUX98_g5914 [Antrodiella citrinella]|uniref:AN1-type domain-containing protein n=1 Tax=Antrodiella citrinella TaxID=2447956 RepID=A0A4S4MQA0_9APHY|nr:hypothetical protein EUX98_g5914 [Antrodiella citrinella]
MAEQDHSLLSVGKQCSHRTCNLVDFLPFKCQHCNESYCGDHFLPQAHQCEHYDETKHNRVAPPCPFCNVPLAIPTGVDPNIAMERHFETDCAVLVGKSAKSSTPRCSRPNCGKILFAPIACSGCKKQFCPNHRFPDDHKCPSAAVSKAPPATRASTSISRPTAASTAAMAAIKRAVNTTTTTAASQKKPQSAQNTRATAPGKLPASTSAASAVSQSSTRSTNPFSATDRSVSPGNSSSNNTATTHTTDDNNANPPRAPSPAISTFSLFAKPYVPRPIFASA